FVPGPPLFLTNHASYFEHATIVLMLTFAVAGWISRTSQRALVSRIFVPLTIAFFCLNGLLLAETGYRKLLPTNREQVDMVRWFEEGMVGDTDLIVTQHDLCAWLPFLTRAQVLYCRNSQAMLTPAQNRSLQRQRESWYLYFMGNGSQWLNNVSADPANVH